MIINFKKLGIILAVVGLLGLTPVGFASQSHHYGSQAEKDFRAGKQYLAKHQTKSAIKYLKRAARADHEKAQYRLGILYYQQKQYKKARFWLRKRARAGDADAQFHYANTFRYALGTKQQTTTARRWYQRAAEQGHVHAQFELAKMFQHGIGAKKNRKKAIYWYQKAASKGHRHARKALALLNVKPGGKKLAKATKKTEKTTHKVKTAKKTVKPRRSLALLAQASKGDPEQQYQLAMRYLLGYDMEDDIEQAIFWLSQAAEKRHPLAEYQLGNQYFKGKSVNRNIPRAVHYFLRAKNHGVKPAETALKVLSQYGYEDVVRAEMGDAKAQYAMAMQYLAGKSNLDKTVALEWLHAAARQSYAPALLQLGIMYEKGIILSKNDKKAFEFYKKAAELENPKAQISLSRMYKSGKGVQPNPTLANIWLNRAAAQGSQEAQKALQFSEL